VTQEDGSSSLTVAGAALAWSLPTTPTSLLAPDIGSLENRNATECSRIALLSQESAERECGKWRRAVDLTFALSKFQIEISFLTPSLTSREWLLYSERTFRRLILRIRLKRESGENPELPRSGKQERKLHLKHWFSHELGSWSE
jgi:hypothetical protein